MEGHAQEMASSIARGRISFLFDGIERGKVIWKYRELCGRLRAGGFSFVKASIFFENGPLEPTHVQGEMVQ
jgi:hypothetical protein